MITITVDVRGCVRVYMGLNLFPKKNHCEQNRVKEKWKKQFQSIINQSDLLSLLFVLCVCVCDFAVVQKTIDLYYTNSDFDSDSDSDDDDGGRVYGFQFIIWKKEKKINKYRFDQPNNLTFFSWGHFFTEMDTIYVIESMAKLMMMMMIIIGHYYRMELFCFCKSFIYLFILLL